MLEYKAVVEQNQFDFEDAVNKAMEFGWSPIGSVCVTYVGAKDDGHKEYLFSQSLTRPKSDGNILVEYAFPTGEVQEGIAR